MRSSDSSLFIISSPEVLKFIRKANGSDVSKKSGFGFALEAGFLVGAQGSKYDHPFSFNFIATYNIDSKNLLGIGSGAEFLGKTFAPLLFEYKHQFNEKNVSPFVFFRSGALLHFGSESQTDNGYPQYGVPRNYRGGVSMSAGTGISWTGESITTYLSFAYRYAQTSYTETDYNNQNVTYKNYYNRLEVKIGFKF